MQLAAFAFDYDGTLAHDGRVERRTVEALERLRAAGVRLLLVSGRLLPELQHIFPDYGLFDALVAENGALLARPALHEERTLGPPPPAALLRAIHKRGIAPLSLGRCIIATCQPNETRLLEAIRECGLEWQIVFNKGAVMCLPPGVNKASGLAAALQALRLSALNVVGVGDAENDHAMLAACGYRAAVANAIDTLKAEADIVTGGAQGEGVIELIERFLSDPPRALTGPVHRHDLVLGRGLDGSAAALSPDATVLIAGSSGQGKSTLATLMIERVLAHGCQLCVVDPEGDYERLAQLTVLGNPRSAPVLEEAVRLLQQPQNNVVLNLLGLELEARPRFLADVTAAIESLRAQYGRPHWLIVDEAHHSLPAAAEAALLVEPRRLPGTVLLTSDPEALSRAFLDTVGVVITLGPQAQEVLERFCRASGVPAPVPRDRPSVQGEALLWARDAAQPVRTVRIDAPTQEHQRHVRKYAQGSLGEDKSFYFRCERGALNLRAQNLAIFLQIAAGVDDATWMHHLRRADYSRWFREAISDQELASAAERVEQRLRDDPVASRRAIHELVSQRYTAPGDAAPI